MIDKNTKCVVIIPVGRKRFLEILMPYVLESKLADEIHLWYNPRTEEDASYINDELIKMSDKVKLIKINGRIDGNWSINEFYKYARDENTIYLKIDDDIVWMSDGAIDKIFDFRAKNQEYFMVSPIVINNGVSAYIQSINDKLHVNERIKRELKHEFDNGGLRIGNCLWYKSAENAILSHRYLFDHVDNTESMAVLGAVLETRFSINAICWHGRILNWVLSKVLIHDDELDLSYRIPKFINMKNYMMGDVFCAHYAFGPQINGVDATDVLSTYRSIRDKRFCTWDCVNKTDN